MTLLFVSSPTSPTAPLFLRRNLSYPSFNSLTVLIPSPNPKPYTFTNLRCRAAKSRTGPPVKKRHSSSSSNNNKKKTRRKTDAEIVDNFIIRDEDEPSGLSTSYNATALPKPPAGFVMDGQGRVVMVSNKRLVTIVDPTNNAPLECVIRRVFRSSNGEECMLLCPVDTPILVVKSVNIEGWSAVNDEEAESLLPTVAYSLAKIHMHFVNSGFCYTARGGFAYSDANILDFSTDDGQEIEGVPTEAVEITCFHMDGAHYMIYTPADPLIFVAVKDPNGQLQIADDDMLDDPAIISAIDEETEFNALVEEEAALLESVMMGDA